MYFSVTKTPIFCKIVRTYNKWYHLIDVLVELLFKRKIQFGIRNGRKNYRIVSAVLSRNPAKYRRRSERMASFGMEKSPRSQIRSFSRCVVSSFRQLANSGWQALIVYFNYTDDVYKEWLLIRYRYVKVTSEVKSFLCELRNSYRLAVISNGTSDAQWEKIRECGLKSYFDSIIISGDTPWKKPDANIFYKVGNHLIERWCKLSHHFITAIIS